MYAQGDPLRGVVTVRELPSRGGGAKEVEEEQEVEDFSNSKDTALAGFPNINGYVKSILKVDDMLRKISNFNTRLAGLLGDRQGVSRSIFLDSIHLLLFWQNFHFLVALV